MSFPFVSRTAALVVAHPGHELVVLGWLERARPAVFVLTDGSGSNGSSRLTSTLRVLRTVGARHGTILGRLSDRAMYEHLLEQNVEMFVALAAELADALVAHDCHYVVGDAWEGYNPSHDVCRLLIDAAISKVRHSRKRHMDNFEFSLTRHGDAHTATGDSQGFSVSLDDASLARKIELARTYTEMSGEVEGALAAHGTEPFRTERFRPVSEHRAGELSDLPFYEQHGAKRVAEGVYSEVVRYGENVRPLAQRLRQWALSSHCV